MRMLPLFAFGTSGLCGLHSQTSIINLLPPSPFLGLFGRVESTLSDEQSINLTTRIILTTVTKYIYLNFFSQRIHFPTQHFHFLTILWKVNHLSLPQCLHPNRSSFSCQGLSLIPLGTIKSRLSSQKQDTNG
jgi:hypothetical protein